jgi:DNA-binding FadR family transcriptional regulator
MDRVPTKSIKAPTLASMVAHQLEDEVIAAGWPVGKVLGSEKELLDRYGISRSVLREAVRIVEHTGAARMRRGPGGGLVVGQPNRAALVAASNVCFSYIGVSISEMLEVRAPLFAAAARLASQRITATGAAALREASGKASRERGDLDDLGRIEHQLATMTGNPSLLLFCDILADLTASRLRSGWAEIRPPLSLRDRTTQKSQYRALGHAVTQGQPDDAEEQATALVARIQSHLVDVRQATPRRWVHSRNDKLAEQVAMAIRDDIERAGWPVGTVLGSETALLERHGVSLPILREAVRILEHHGAVQTKRGPGGGLAITAPDVGVLRRASRLYLQYQGVHPDGLFETRSVVEIAMARLAAKRTTPEMAAALSAALDSEGRGNGAVADFGGVHAALATASGNRLLVVFVEILADVIHGGLRSDEGDPTRLIEIASVAHRAHERIVEAVVAGDAECASRRMRRHLDASVGVLH